MSEKSNPDQRKGLFNLWIFDSAITLPFILVTTLIISLILNIVIEWIGMAAGWWDLPGSRHATSMLSTELTWLHQDFRHALGQPVKLAETFVQTAYGWLFVWNGEDIAAAYQHATTDGLAGYITAAITITQLFVVRLAIMTLSIPVFAVFGAIALVDGLNTRSLRRWGGALEKGYVYHHAKRTLAPFLLVPIVLYLSSPWSLHPNWVVMPFAALFASGVWLTAMTFKQNL